MAKKKRVNNEPLEKQLWKSADKLRKNIDAAEYKHVVLGLIFLKYISDAFEELYDKLKKGEGEYAGADPEDSLPGRDRRYSGRGRDGGNQKVARNGEAHPSGKRTGTVRL